MLFCRKKKQILFSTLIAHLVHATPTFRVTIVHVIPLYLVVFAHCSVAIAREKIQRRAVVVVSTTAEMGFRVLLTSSYLPQLCHSFAASNFLVSVRYPAFKDLVRYPTLIVAFRHTHDMIFIFAQENSVLVLSSLSLPFQTQSDLVCFRQQVQRQPYSQALAAHVFMLSMH
jgi:hypothetical protein